MISAMYPAIRYHRTLPRRKVHDLAEDTALGPDWRDRPFSDDEQADPEPSAPARTLPDRAVTITPGAPSSDTPPVGPQPEPSDAPEPKAPEPVDPTDARAKELYATKADDIVTRVKDATNVDALTRSVHLEAANPKYPGGRKRVIEALEQRIAALGEQVSG